MLELNLLIAVGIAIVTWQWIGRGREVADRAAQQVCRDLGVQRLDDAVALHRMRLQRGPASVQLIRVYRFEYSAAGIERNDGELTLVNARPGWARLHDGERTVHFDLS